MTRHRIAFAVLISLLTFSTATDAAEYEPKVAVPAVSPAATGQELTGVVLTPDGQPAAGAQVAIANWTSEVQILKGKLSYGNLTGGNRPRIEVTDSAGRFHLAPQVDPQVIVVAHDSGFAEVDDPRAGRQGDVRPKPELGQAERPTAVLRITLQKWGRVIGVLRVEGKPIVGARFRLGSLSSKKVRRAPQRASHLVETDADGRFYALRVPPGPAWCQRYIPDPDEVEGFYSSARSVWTTQFDVVAGTTFKLLLGSDATMTVTGRFVLPAGPPNQKWTGGRVGISPYNISQFNSSMYMERGRREEPRVEALHKSKEGRIHILEVDLAEDGSFRIEDLAAGDHFLHVRVGEKIETYFLRIKPARPDGSEKVRDIGEFRFDLASSQDPKQPPAKVAAQERMSDAQAVALVRRAVRFLTAIDRLPRFYYRITLGRGPVDGLHGSVGATLETLQRAIDGPVFQDTWRFQPVTFAWSGHDNLSATGNGIVPHETFDASSHCHVWTATEAFDRSMRNPKSRPRFEYSVDPASFGRSVSGGSPFFEIAPHEFSWGKTRDSLPEDRLPPIDPATFQSFGTELFEGDLCDVVESLERQEQLWISRKSGLLRVVLRFDRKAALMHLDRLKQGMRRSSNSPFTKEPEFHQWFHGHLKMKRGLQTRSQKEDWVPREMIVFRDYREVAPGAWVPFRQDCAVVEGSPNYYACTRSWAAVQDVRLDVDLRETIQRLRPRTGDQITRDARFGLTFNYEYRDDQNTTQLLQLLDSTRRTGRLKVYEFQRTQPLNRLLSERAPSLPEEGWIGGNAPELKGNPYVLHFWAAWTEAPQQDFESLRKLAAEGVNVVGIHPAGTPRADIERVIKQQKLGYPTLLAPSIPRDNRDQRIVGYPVWTFPYGILVDKLGRVVDHGPIDKDFLEKCRKLQDEKENP